VPEAEVHSASMPRRAKPNLYNGETKTRWRNLPSHIKSNAQLTYVPCDAGDKKEPD